MNFHPSRAKTTNIRRYRLPGNPVFITAVCHRRNPILGPDTEKERLLAVMREVQAEIPFKMVAYVILSDHFHWLIRPEGDADFSRIMQSVKLRFTRRYKLHHGITGNLALWQRRFWDHMIRDEDDLRRHLDYIHYNPAKHDYVTEPAGYRWSSFPAYLAKGHYPPAWAASGVPENIASLNLE